MRFLIIDASGAALDISYRAKQHGHQVKHFIRRTPKTEHIGRGFVDIVDDFRPWLNWADLIFLPDNTKYLRDVDAHRLVGIPVVGPSVEAAAWELDRDEGMRVLKKHGIATPPSVEFNDYDKAIAHVKKHNKRFVSKPSGDADKALSYVSKSPADLCYMLERWKKTSKLKGAFILQEFIPGIEMAVGGWFGPDGFVKGWCENFEFKKLMDGDMGVATGEQGTVLRYVARSKLARMVLEPLTEALEKLEYVGYIDVNCIIDEKGQPWPLEFTMRPGWPTFNIQQELHGADPAEWLWRLATGHNPDISLNRIALGVVLSIPDYPYSHLTRKEVIGSPIYGITPRLSSHLHMCEMMEGEAPVDRDGKISNEKIPTTAGDYVLIMSGTGETVYGAKQVVYRRLKSLTVPNSPMWRTDIGDRLSKQLPKLQENGFATGMDFSISQEP